MYCKILSDKLSKQLFCYCDNYSVNFIPVVHFSYNERCCAIMMLLQSYLYWIATRSVLNPEETREAAIKVRLVKPLSAATCRALKPSDDLVHFTE